MTDNVLIDVAIAIVVIIIITTVLVFILKPKHSPPQPPSPPCTPFCNNKICNLDDGCGNKCKCPQDEQCIGTTCMDGGTDLFMVKKDDSMSVVILNSNSADSCVTNCKNKPNCKIWSYDGTDKSLQCTLYSTKEASPDLNSIFCPIQKAGVFAGDYTGKNASEYKKCTNTCKLTSFSCSEKDSCCPVTNKGVILSSEEVQNKPNSFIESILCQDPTTNKNVCCVRDSKKLYANPKCDDKSIPDCSTLPDTKIRPDIFSVSCGIDGPPIDITKIESISNKACTNKKENDTCKVTDGKSSYSGKCIQDSKTKKLGCFPQKLCTPTDFSKYSEIGVCTDY